MNKRFTLPFLALLAALAVGLLFLLPGGPLQAQNSFTVEYVENSEDDVATFSASDPEGAMPIVWSLPAPADDPDGDEGPLAATDAQDNGDFKITQGGVLSFKSSPDFEAAGDDTYNVVVQASDGGTMDTLSWFKVIVNVQDMEEQGSIKLRAQEGTTLLQPRVGVVITSYDLMDGDGVESSPPATYQWYRTTSRSAMGTAISSDTTNSTGTGETYTPVADDVDEYLRVVATYADGRGGDKTATEVSMYKTIAAAISDNEVPAFPTERTTRRVRENTEKGINIGIPVTATDDDSDDKLTYWLTEAATSPFSIDAATGQLMTKNKLNFETDGDATTSDGPSHIVTVNVADSSGNDANTIIVTITVINVNEDPTVSGASTIEHVEDATALDIELSNDDTPPGNDAAEYMATDDEASTTFTFSLGGADKDMFELTGSVEAMRTLAFKAKPDFEMPMDSNNDNVYEVMVQASDGSNTGMKAVTVKVTNMEDTGKVKVMPSQPQAGVELTADLTDSDGVVYGPMWQWQRGATTDPVDGTLAECASAAAVTTSNAWMNIPGAKSETYTPGSGDLGYCLQATAMYSDGFYDTGTDTATMFEKTASKALSVVQAPTENIAPMFAGTMTKRFVPEGMAEDTAVGKPVTASDPGETLSYTLGGTDKDSFSINSAMGQLTTKMKFDHETKNRYTVTVTATDSEGATDSIRVDIMVTDVDEKPMISQANPDNRAPVFSSSATSRSVAENTPAGRSIGSPVTATDPDTDSLTYSLSGADGSSFGIGSTSGQLMTKAALDYETKNSYTVTVIARDPSGGSDTITVTINVTDVVNEEAPPADSVLAEYDDNNSGRIERTEVLTAIGDLVFQRTTIQRDDVLVIIGAFVFQRPVDGT